ncbi:MAG: alpha/beta fold hydrolase [Candidatus Binatia bacterium]
MSVFTGPLNVRGIHITLHRAGEGEPLLYLHSAGAEATAWGPPMEQLAEHFDVIAPVHPGFPGSAGIDKVHHIADLVLHYVDLLDALHLRRAHVVGASLGGWIAAELASLYPERVAGLVLCGAAGLWIEGAPVAEIFGISPAALAELVFYDQEHPIARMMRAAGEADARGEIPPEDVLIAFHQSNEATARIAWKPYFHNPALERRLDRIASPTLVLWGAEDRLIPRAHAERYRNAIPGAELRTVPACGHSPQLETPDAFATIVTEFLRAHPLSVRESNAS